MILQLTSIPKQWDGKPVGKDDGPGGDDEPRDLRSFLIQALNQAAMGAELPTGQRKNEGPEPLLKRFRLSMKIEEAGDEVELDTEDFQLCEQCIAALFITGVSVRLLGALHAAVGSEETKAD
jgi:hypothetical protein